MRRKPGWPGVFLEGTLWTTLSICLRTIFPLHMDKAVPPEDFCIPGSSLHSGKQTAEGAHNTWSLPAMGETTYHSGQSRAPISPALEACSEGTTRQRPRRTAAEPIALWDTRGYSGHRVWVRASARCPMHLFLPPAQTSFPFRKRGHPHLPGARRIERTAPVQVHLKVMEADLRPENHPRLM